MIKAKFVKAYTTENGITYMLKGEKSKLALKLAADLQDEDCYILVASDEETKHDPETEGLINLIVEYGKSKFREGVNQVKKGYVCKRCELAGRKYEAMFKLDNDGVCSVYCSECSKDIKEVKSES